MGCISPLLFEPLGGTGISRGTGFQPVAIFGRAFQHFVEQASSLWQFSEGLSQHYEAENQCEPVPTHPTAV
ncbi:hypothetical protein, partial [Moorena sp. SIO4A1]|uniref:hypothetical protein n=1 Tax=Moorena sp. SIO4A1 TaxID=2607835 RepID=UPI0025F94C83